MAPRPTILDVDTGVDDALAENTLAVSERVRSLVEARA
jgi:hypothetical protein